MAPFDKAPDSSGDIEKIPSSFLVDEFNGESGNETVLASPILQNKDAPRMTHGEPLYVTPLRMIPYGGKDPIPFSEEELDRLTKKRKKKQQVPIPEWLETHRYYVKGDWKAFSGRRDTGQLDWVYEHRVYRKKFRSGNEVDEFLEAIRTPLPTFKGRKLQIKKTVGPNGQGTGKIKSARGKKAAKSTKFNGANVSVSEMPSDVL